LHITTYKNSYNLNIEIARVIQKPRRKTTYLPRFS
jgi:hypothetical protein